MKSPNHKPAGRVWKWQRGPVDTRDEHLRLVHQDPDDDTSPEREVARIAKPIDGDFTVELIGAAKEPAVREAIGEIEFLLVGMRENDPWLYTRHHCNTAANIYSSIHWTWHPASQHRRSP